MNGKNNRVKGCWGRGATNKHDNNRTNLKPIQLSSVVNINSKNMTFQQKSLLKFFKYLFPTNNILENFSYNNNTPYATIFLKQSDFNNGTVRITKPGKYVLLENITFNPNEDNDFSPTPEQISSGLYPELMKGPYHLGFFAAITIETNNVILDLNGKTLKQSENHAFQQRFYSNIELANSPFIPKQGPGDFNGSTGFKSADNIFILNGTLERSSHHGIHANSAKNVFLYKLDIKNFEVAGIALNGSTNSIVSDIEIHDNTQHIHVLSTYSQARFIRRHINAINDASSINILGNDISARTIKTQIDDELEKTFSAFKNGEELPDNIFKNPEPEKGYDGNVYGMVLHVNGVVINDFIQERTSKMTGNINIYLNNINISNLSSNPIELLGVSDISGTCSVNEAYGKNVQSGPVGGIIQFENIVSDKTNIDGTYVSNILSNAQFIVSKFSKKPKVTKCILDWASQGTNLKEKAIVEQGYYYVSGRDSMGHTMKGSIGLFISGGINIKGYNINVSNVKNIAKVKDFSNLTPICPVTQSSQPYDAKNNIIVASNNIILNKRVFSNTSALHIDLSKTKTTFFI